MEKVEALEDMVSLAPSSLVKVDPELLLFCFPIVILIVLKETTGETTSSYVLSYKYC